MSYEIKQYDEASGECASFDAYFNGKHTAHINGWTYKGEPQDKRVCWASIGSVAPVEARAFAEAIIAVTDAAEKEGGE